MIRLLKNSSNPKQCFESFSANSWDEIHREEETHILTNYVREAIMSVDNTRFVTLTCDE